MVDELPAIQSIEKFYGRSVLPCPYCDGGEWREHPLAVYGRGEKERAITDADPVEQRSGALHRWPRLTLRSSKRTPGVARNTGAREPIARLGTEDSLLSNIVFANGEALAIRAMFFNTGERQRSPLSAKLGCELDENGRGDNR